MAVREADDVREAADPWVTASMKALLSADQSQIMDFVDHLRRLGLNGIIRLPQLVVCGDQSSGKSSVLEAIAEIPFPRKENLCTRFATEIVLRTHSSTSIKTRITPDRERPAAEREELQEFDRTIEHIGDLPKLIDEAAKAMGVGGKFVDSRAFARDVLTVEISGPDRPQL